MSVLSVRDVAELGMGPFEDEPMVRSSGREFTLACDWPDCDEKLTAIQERHFLQKRGWRFCGTGKQHLCETHSSHTDKELEAAEQARKETNNG